MRTRKRSFSVHFHLMPWIKSLMMSVPYLEHNNNNRWTIIWWKSRDVQQYHAQRSSANLARDKMQRDFCEVYEWTVDQILLVSQNFVLEHESRFFNVLNVFKNYSLNVFKIDAEDIRMMLVMFCCLNCDGIRKLRRPSNDIGRHGHTW